ncbi:MAG: VapE domain-containing protein [Prochlorococcaceae cyanobacterium]|jgi:predicted P-loop ATPase
MVTTPVELARLPKPIQPQPGPYMYSVTQRITRIQNGAKEKSFPAEYLDGQIWRPGRGPDQWPLWHEAEALTAKGMWVLELEGEKCADLARSGGLLAISQPGHSHSVGQISPRYGRLLAAGIAGVLFVSDNDQAGLKRAAQSAKAAAAEGLPFLHVPAIRIWPDLPAGGSVDDAPGSPAEWVEELLQAIPQALDQQQQPKALTLEDLLGPAEEGKMRRPRKDVLPRVLEAITPLRLNLLTQRIEYDGEAIDGDFLGTFYLRLAEEHGLDVAKDRAIDAATFAARRNAYHPVADYLNGLTEELSQEDWAAIDVRCFGSEDSTGWSVLHLQRQLIGLVARAMKPGCELHTCLVLMSEDQGAGKSTFWKVLGGEWFSDSLGDLRDIREDRIQLHSAWIHEWGEIDNVIGKRESETLKRFISCSRDDCRKPYGRGIEKLERSCGLVGTTNRRDFMKDPTGNRRFPVIRISSVHLDWVKANRDRIWASAVAAYRRGERWWYTREEGQLVSDHAHAFSAEDPLRDAIEAWAEDHPTITEAPTVRVLMDLGYGDQLKDQALRLKVGNAMTALGWRRTESKRRYLLPDGSKTDKAWGWVLPADVPTDVPSDVPSQDPSADMPSPPTGDMGTSDRKSLGGGDVEPSAGTNGSGNIRLLRKETMSPMSPCPQASPPAASASQ